MFIAIVEASKTNRFLKITERKNRTL